MKKKKKNKKKKLKKKIFKKTTYGNFLKKKITFGINTFGCSL